MLDPMDHLKELKAALAEAIQTIELAPVLPKKVVSERLLRFRSLAASMAPLVTADMTFEKVPPLRVYVEQLEGLAKRVAETAGPVAEQAKLFLSPANQKAIGLDIARPITGKVRIVDLRPTLREQCLQTASGVHEIFSEGKKVYCRACGVEERAT